jgi:hypothetical protein
LTEEEAGNKHPLRLWRDRIAEPLRGMRTLKVDQRFQWVQRIQWFSGLTDEEIAIVEGEN